jgi:hypothetical protein
LGLRNDGSCFYIFRDDLSGLEYIRNSRDLYENGLYVELDAYKCHVFLDWREVQDNEWHQYAHLADYLGGRGVPSIEEALREVFLQPVHYPFKDLVNAGAFGWLIEHRVTTVDEHQDLTPLLDEVEQKALHLLSEMQQFTGDGADKARTTAVEPKAIAEELRRKLEAALQLPILAERFPLPRTPKYRAAVERVNSRLDGEPAAWGTLLAWLFTHALGKVVDKEDYAAQSRSWMDEWLLGKLVAGTLQDLGLDEDAAWWAVGIVKVLINHQGWFEPAASEGQAYQILVSWLRDGEVQQLLQVNRYGGVLWFNQEAFEQLLTWMLTTASIEISADPRRTSQAIAGDIVGCYDVIERLQQAGKSSEFQVVKLMEAAQS